MELAGLTSPEVAELAVAGALLAVTSSIQNWWGAA
jgi:hypothetical protein